MSFETTISRLAAGTARVAVFIDADNLSAGHAGSIFKQCGPTPRLLRAYGNLATGAQGWPRQTKAEFIHTGAGKNASDLALAVDAVVAAHRHDLTHVLICSSDRDFRHVAIALREMGIIVIGMGVAGKRPEPFADACSRWIPLEEPAPATPTSTTKKSEADKRMEACLDVVGAQTLLITTFAQALLEKHKLRKSQFKCATWAKVFNVEDSPLEVIGGHPALKVRLRK